MVEALLTEADLSDVLAGDPAFALARSSTGAGMLLPALMHADNAQIMQA